MGDWSESTTASDNTEYLGRESKVESEVGSPIRNIGHFLPQGGVFSLDDSFNGRPSELTLAPPRFRQLISLPFNCLYCILVVKIGEEGMKNGK